MVPPGNTPVTIKELWDISDKLNDAISKAIDKSKLCITEDFKEDLKSLEGDIRIVRDELERVKVQHVNLDSTTNIKVNRIEKELDKRCDMSQEEYVRLGGRIQALEEKFIYYKYLAYTSLGFAGMVGLVVLGAVLTKIL